MQAHRMDMLCTNWLPSRSSGCQASAVTGLPGSPGETADFCFSCQIFQGTSRRGGTSGRSFFSVHHFLVCPYPFKPGYHPEKKQLHTYKGALPDSLGICENYTSNPHKLKSIRHLISLHKSFVCFRWMLLSPQSMGIHSVSIKTLIS